MTERVELVEHSHTSVHTEPQTKEHMLERHDFAKVLSRGVLTAKKVRMRPPPFLMVLFSMHACQAATTAMDLGTKTPYPASPTPSSPKQGGGEACTLKHLTVVARHGSRHSGHIA